MLESLTMYKINESINNAYKSMYKKQVIMESGDVVMFYMDKWNIADDNGKLIKKVNNYEKI
jgi:hypothetical protein